MAGSIDKFTEIAHEALQDTEHDNKAKSARDQQWKTRLSMIDELKNNRQVLLEIVLVRHIENYLNYLSGLLFEVFRQRPETLKSSERVELATVSGVRRDNCDSVGNKSQEPLTFPACFRRDSQFGYLPFPVPFF